MKSAGSERTQWINYAQTNAYKSEEERAKEGFVADFTEAVKPAILFDLGCNTGKYARIALGAGAGYVIGFDSDHGALERAFDFAAKTDSPFLPLYQNAFNPSPDQGWSQTERRGLRARAKADAVLALAFLHHLTIGNNVPLPRAVRWILNLAPTGMMEFIPKGDPMIKRMLAFREDIFSEYSIEAFEQYLAKHARIVRTQRITASGRQLYWFERRQA